MSIAGSSEGTLGHVVVSGGTPHEWLDMSHSEWVERVNTLLRAARIGGVRWVTLLPHHGQEFSDIERRQYVERLGVNDKDSSRKITTVASGLSDRYVLQDDSGTTVIIDPRPDGHERFAGIVEALRRDGVDPSTLTEESLSRAILKPAEIEPDLVVVLGPPDVIPDSMVWELAYSELVFLDLGWGQLTSSHLELAIDDFTRRHRRFGGLDS